MLNFYVETGYVEPGYFESEPAPPGAVKIERLTVYKERDLIVVYRMIDVDAVYEDIESIIAYRPINRTLVDHIVTPI
jgi:hypothetical protein